MIIVLIRSTLFPISLNAADDLEALFMVVFVFAFVFVLEDSSKKLGKVVHNVCVAVSTDFE